MQAIPFFMSMSVATPCEDVSAEKKAPPKSLALCIKNTFIDILDETTPQLMKRSASAPATPRGSGVSPSSSLADLWAGRKSPATRSEVSTSSELDANSEFSDSCCGESMVSDSEGTIINLSELLPPPQAPPRTKLSAGAKAWAPKFHAASVKHMPSDVQCKFAEIMAAAQASWMSCPCVQQVGCVQRDPGWLLEATCQQTDLPNAQLILTLAKQALLDAAEKSQNVYILGYKKSPFESKVAGLGFSVQLAIVEDETSACWDLLETGTCHRGCSCRWQHPTWQMPLTVLIKSSRH
jgi:hypothetical protein